MANPMAGQADMWSLGASGLWSAAADWSLGEPAAGQGVSISEPFTVTFDLARFVVGALTVSDATLAVEGGPLVARDGATLTGATVAGSGVLTLRGASAANALTLSGSATLLNLGEVTQSGGNVQIGTVAGPTPRTVNAAGATWTIAANSGITHSANGGYAFINRGLFQKTSGGYSVIQSNFDSTGVISSAGILEFDGKHNFFSGTYTGTDEIFYGSGSVSTLGALDDAGEPVQWNSGVVNLVGDMTVDDGSHIENDGNWNFDGDSSLLLGAGQATGPLLTSYGTLAKTAGAGVSTIATDLTTFGKVYVNTGTLALAGPLCQFIGGIQGPGNFETSGGTTIIESNSVGTAEWTLAGGETVASAYVTYYGDFVGEAGATLSSDGFSLSLAGEATLSGLTLTQSGTLYVMSTADVSGATIGGTWEFIDQGLVMQSGGDVTLGDSVATDAAKLLIAFGGVWNIGDGSAIKLGGSPYASTITLGIHQTTGTLEKTGAGVGTVAPSILNNSASVTSSAGFKPYGIIAEGGTLDIQGVVSGTGSDTILQSATLEFDNAVASTQSVTFSGSGATLALSDLSLFSAPISGFDVAGTDDAIVFDGAWVLSNFIGASESATSTTLSILQYGAGSPTTLTLLGDYVGHTFTSHFLEPTGALVIE